MTATTEATQPKDRFDLVGTILDGKFRVERLVAEGGFGIVYAGRHLTLERAIAIKVLKTPTELNAEAREEFIERFALEAKTIARVAHPNIVQVLDFGASTMPSGVRAPWMVLEWLTGKTLEEELAARSGMIGRSPAEALALLRPVFEAMAFAHDEGIAHRDLKPANLMMVTSKRGTWLRLLDFGIAKVMDETDGARTGQTNTRAALAACSPDYAAPEQISLMRTGPWTDVHGLALVLVEVITGATPYAGESMGALYAQILSPTRPTPGARAIDVGAWEAVLARALAIDPDARYHNAGEFLAALDKGLASATAAYEANAVVEDSSDGPALTLSAPTSGTSGSSSTLLGSRSSDAVPATSHTVSGPLVPDDAPGRRRPMALVAGGGLVLLAVAGVLGLRAFGHAPPSSAAPPVAAAAAVTAVAPGGRAASDPVVPSTALTLAPPSTAAPTPGAPATPTPLPGSTTPEAPAAPVVLAPAAPATSAPHASDTATAPEHRADPAHPAARHGGATGGRAHGRGFVPVELE